MTEVAASCERLVYETEQERLRRVGGEELAEKVEWVSQTSGDGLGFDILSYDETADRELLIEVKTTTLGKYFPFYVSRNEVVVSEQRSEDYRLHRLFNFNKGPRLYTLSGALTETCELEPRQYEARAK